MKNIIKSVCIGALVFSLISCDLDLAPKTNMGPDNVTTVKDAKAVREGVYGLFRELFMGAYNYDPDYQSDLFNELASSGNRGGMMYRWMLVSSDGDVTSIWQNHYKVLANINFLIGKIDEIYGGMSAADKATLDQYKGEMYLLRAMCHRQVALRFCKDYEPTTAATDLGAPIITSYDPSYKPSRGTMENTYQQITDDIATAEGLVTLIGTANAAYITVDAVTAFKAQVLLDMHKYPEASAAAASLYSKYPLVTSALDLEKMWREDSSTETIFQPAMTKTDLTGRYTDYHAGKWDATINDYRCDCAYIPEQWVCDLYDTANDWRYGPYVGEEHINNMENSDVTGIVLTKYRGNKNLETTAGVLVYYNMPKVLRIADMYLIDAEAKVRASGDAATPLNTLRAARGLATGTAALADVQKERAREMIAEGGRIPDLKRWHIGFTRDKQTAPGLLFSQTGHDMTVAADADKFVWPIPRTEIESNRNLIQNPGWGE